LTFPVELFIFTYVKMNKSSDAEQSDLCDPTAVAAARRALIDADQAEQIAQLFKLLGDPSRTRIIHTLVSVDEMCVGDLAAVCDVSETVVSHSLRLLRASGIVGSERRGRRVHYRLVDPHPANVILLTLDAIDDAATPSAADESALERSRVS